MENLLKKFTETFFKNLGCSVTCGEKFIEVKNVPEKFEKFFGKNGPYKISFDKKYSDDGIEIVSNGSYLLKSMKNYLENSGGTTLLKINFVVNPEEEISTRIKIENASIDKISKKYANKFFT